jgi:hypothetical protein
MTFQLGVVSERETPNAADSVAVLAVWQRTALRKPNSLITGKIEGISLKTPLA